MAFNREGDLLIVDSTRCRIYKYSPEGKSISDFGSHGEAPGKLNNPYGVALDNEGLFYYHPITQLFPHLLLNHSWSKVRLDIFLTFTKPHTEVQARSPVSRAFTDWINR